MPNTRQAAPATVTVKIAGTAINNVHYQLLTPTLTFAKGDAFQPISIRLIDNAAIDGDRTLIVSYTISGTGVVPMLLRKR